ncbi:MAG: lysophospholipid acyltransferase family protein [Planctomycetota bacterium]
MSSLDPSPTPAQAFRGVSARLPGSEATRRKQAGFARKLKTARRFLIYWFGLAPLIGLVRRLPRPLVRAFLRGVVEPIFHRSTVARSRRHLALVYGDSMPAAERDRVARAVSRNFVTGILELLEILDHGPGPAMERCDASALEPMLEALRRRRKQGFVGVTAHLGNWELLGSWFARSGIVEEVAAIATPHSNPWLDRRIVEFRSKLGMRTFRRTEANTGLIRYLREGHAVAIVPDQDVKNIAGIFVDFLGHRAYTAVGPARLALAADIPIVCGFLVRVGADRYRLHVADLIVPDRTAPREAEVERLTRAWSRAIEDAVRAFPEQWAWFHERWRTTPERLLARGRAELGAQRDDASS